MRGDLSRELLQDRHRGRASSEQGSSAGDSCDEPQRKAVMSWICTQVMSGQQDVAFHLDSKDRECEEPEARPCNDVSVGERRVDQPQNCRRGRTQLTHGSEGCVNATRGQRCSSSGISTQFGRTSVQTNQGAAYKSQDWLMAAMKRETRERRGSPPKRSTRVGGSR